jgi:hypothetical protein
MGRNLTLEAMVRNLYVQMGEWLGRQPPATEAEILRIVEERLAPAIINRLISLGLERSEIDAAVILCVAKIQSAAKFSNPATGPSTHNRHPAV